MTVDMNDEDDWILWMEVGAVTYEDLPPSLQTNVDFLVRIMTTDLYAELPPHLKQESDICFAVAMDVLDPIIDDLDADVVEFMFTMGPPVLAECKDFWQLVFRHWELEGIEQFFLRYAPQEIRRDFDFMLEANRLCGRFVWSATHPSLRSNPRFVEEIRQHFHTKAREGDDVFHFAPPFVTDDATIMSLAIRNCSDGGYLYGNCSLRLQQDIAVIRLAITNQGGLCVLDLLSRDFVLSNIVIVKEFFWCSDTDDINVAAQGGVVPVEVWNVEDLLIVFFKNGGKPHGLIPTQMFESVEVCRALLGSYVMTHDFEINPWKFIQIRTHEFYEKIASDGSTFVTDLYHFDSPVRTPPELWNSFLWQLKTVYGYCQTKKLTAYHGSHILDCLPKPLRHTFAMHVLEEVRAFDTFLSTVLPAICIHRKPPRKSAYDTQRSSHLRMLDGKESLKRLVAEFVGVPTGKRLTMLRFEQRACRNYLRMWFGETESCNRRWHNPWRY